MSNFAFLPERFRAIADSAAMAEGHVMGDPRAACFHARFTLEASVHWLYRHDAALRLPYDQSLGALLHEPTFQNLLPQAVFQKARVIQKVGNQAVHGQRAVCQQDALQVAKELHHICYWLVRTYTPDASRQGAAWQDARVPPAPESAAVVPRRELEALEQQLAEHNAEALKRQQERDALDAELQSLREQLAEIRAAAEQEPDPHDYSEAETRRYLIDIDLHRAGWPLDQPRDREYEVTGMPNNRGVGYVDYVLWGDDGKPLAVVEAKKTTADPAVGRQQAKLYADCLQAMHGQRPVIFYSNGYANWLWDDVSYPPRRVAGFYKKDELARLILRRSQRRDLDLAQVKDAIVERYYQKRAIGSIFAQFTSARRKALLVMATGTGKTRTAIALVDVLQRAGWVKRALFLADRVSLVNQACNAFKAHLPEVSPVNLVTEKDTEGRVYVCTYPTLMGLIDQTDGGAARFGVGRFDLVIIDEAHRSVYQKYGAIFRYFDALLVGLTATPREEVDRNTYELFELEPGVPTDAYELSEAVADGFLVPPRVQQVDLRFPREGIDYDALSDEEKAPHIAISVDMLDTGIDVPEVANLVFFKPVYSKIKFWQMIGRGTRLCADLFGPEEDKGDFRVFDFCFNFDFFRENPEGIDAGGSAPLGTRLFRARVQLLGRLQTSPELDPDAALRGALAGGLHGEVAAMNRDNFIVRMHLEAVERFQQRDAWNGLAEADRATLQREVAGLPSELETDDIESRLFDLTVLRLQLARAEGDDGAFERHRQRVVEIAMLLEEKTAIPAVAAQLEYLAGMQETAFWEGIGLAGLEELRLRLRGLVPFLDRKTRKIVYTDFRDEVLGVRDDPAVPIPKMTGAQYEKKVRDYLRRHLNHIVIHRLRTNQPLTETDLQGIEKMLTEVGEDDGATLLSGLLARSGAPSLAHFVRSLVGMDRSAAQATFSQYLNDRSLTARQIRFIEMVIDQLTARGVMAASALYEPPFSNLHAGGPDALFAGKETVIEGIFEQLDTIHSGLVGQAR